jgi:hypothetical protein
MPCSSNNNQDEPQDCMNNISGNTKNNFINQPYITMSDPSNNGGNSPSTTPSIWSYFTGANASSEFKNDLSEMILVFVTSFGISLYMNDTAKVGAERASFLFVGRYLGAFLADAMVNAGYFQSSANMMQYSPLLVKFATATSVFIAGNRYALGSTQPIQNLFGESGIASIVAHYGAPYINTSVQNVENSVGSYY